MQLNFELDFISAQVTVLVAMKSRLNLARGYYRLVLRIYPRRQAIDYGGCEFCLQHGGHVHSRSQSPCSKKSTVEKPRRLLMY